LAVSGRGVFVLDRSLGARFKPNFSLCSKWLPLLRGEASAKYQTTDKVSCYALHVKGHPLSSTVLPRGLFHLYISFYVANKK